MADPIEGEVIPLGERLKQHRTERGLSQAQAARELDVARTAYRLWEMEAAKPSPDRWRLIAGWLGVSISTMLLAEDLIDEEDASTADLIAGRATRPGEESWDQIAAASAGDFFEQERATIARQALGGRITAAESGRLSASLDRLAASVGTADAAPVPATFRKQLNADVRAAELARMAVVVTASGVDDDIVDRAELLISELVTNSVERGGTGAIWLAITMHADMLRVEVADQPAAAKPKRLVGDRVRWSFSIIDELASRWGAGREAGLNVSWFEIDLGHPTTAASTG
jgi:transcriptional regulator with XRE-family HTH domain